MRNIESTEVKLSKEPRLMDTDIAECVTCFLVIVAIVLVGIAIWKIFSHIVNTMDPDKFEESLKSEGLGELYARRRGFEVAVRDQRRFIDYMVAYSREEHQSYDPDHDSFKLANLIEFKRRVNKVIRKKEIQERDRLKED